MSLFGDGVMKICIQPKTFFRRGAWPLIALALASLLLGCGQEKDADSADYAYVAAPQVALRDRVAAVYNKVGTVNNGERVRVLDRSQNRRFVRVRSAEGKEGWMELRLLVGPGIYDAFSRLARENSTSATQAHAVARRIVNLHVQPARNSETLYQLKDGARLELLKRASTPKSGIRKAAAKTEADSKVDSNDDSKDASGEDEDKPEKPPAMPVSKAARSVAAAAAAAADPLEDWWLVRDQQKHVGWMLGRMLDIEVPLEIAQYAEGQRIVAALVLNEVPQGSAPPGTSKNKDDQDKDAKDAKDKKVRQYAVLMTEPRDGLPYDFNQLRIFTWNAKRARYETAYRERLNGELPVTVGHEIFDKEGNLPTITVRSRDAQGKPQTRKFKMNGVVVRRVPSAEELAAGRQPAKKPGP